MLKKVSFVMIAVAVLAAPAFADPHTLDTCAVTGKSLGDTPVTKTVDGREVRFCCNNCAGKFEADPAKYTAKLDEAYVKQQTALYALDTCVVGGDKLGKMGDIVSKVYDNRLVKFCCADCIESFEKDQAKYIAKLDEAVVAKQAANYPLESCLVKGEAIDDDPIDLVIGGRLLKLCCEGCIKKVNAEPAKYLAMLDITKK